MKQTDEQWNKFFGELEDIHGIDWVEPNDCNDEDENDLYEIYGTGGYNVDWCDREGRHPWVDLKFTIDLEEMTYECEGELESKAGDLYEHSERKGSFDKINGLPGRIDDEFSDIAHEVENAR